MEVFCMCGIVGYSGKRSAQEVLLNGLEKLEYRGYDSAGVALALEGGIHVVKSKGRLEVLRRKLEAENLPESFCGIGHTRWATHGEPSDVNSHPHSTPRVSIVHNGIIENYGPLKADLMAKGVTFESETDTEVLVKLIDYFCCAQPKQSPLAALREALAMVRGSYALGVLFREEPDTIYAVKKESPLIVGWGEGENFVASDIPALLKYTRRYSVLEEGDMAVVKADGIRFYDAFGKPVEREVLTADWDEEAAEKGGYPHFMLKEIHEQPAAITATVSPRVENGMPDLRIPELSDEKLRSDSRAEEYDTEEGACRHILEFTKGKQGGKEVLSGKETFIVTTTGNTKTDTHDFTWKWIDNSREGLILNYGSGDVKIFENVWVREHYLSGKLDGEIMMLTASRYMVNQNWK